MSIKTTLAAQLNGNLHKKFGLELPVPFVEGVVVNSDSLVVTNCLYLNLNAYGAENIDDVIKSMSKMNFYNMIAYDRSYTDTSASVMVSDNTLTDVVAGARSPLSIMSPGVSYVDSDETVMTLRYPSYGNSSNVYAMPSIGDRSATGWSVVDTYYNDELNPIVKIISTTTIPTDMKLLSRNTDDSQQVEATDYLPTYVETQYPRNTIHNVGVLSFTTILDLSPKMGGSDYDNVVDAYENNLGTKYLYGSLTSDVNSLRVYKNGELDPMLNTVYLTESEEIVTGALQALDGNYYSPDEVTLPVLIGFFKALVGSSDLEDLQSMYDTFLTLIKVNDQNSSLIFEVNNFLETFVEKSTASPVGRFYNRIQKRTVQANKLILRGTPCQKQQLKMPIIIDARDAIIESVHSSYTIPNPDDYSDEDFIYTNSIYMSRTKYNDIATNTTTQVDAGYLFFDYEKLLAKKSKLSQYVDPFKIEHHFGKDAIRSYFYMKSAHMSLTDSVHYTDAETTCEVDAWDPLLTFTLNFEDSTPTNIPTSYEVHLEELYSGGITDSFVFDSSLYGSSHFYLRNFNSTDPSTLTTTVLRDDGEFYKIMCYDFKYILEEPDDLLVSSGAYMLTFEVNDHSETVYFNLAVLVLNCLASIQNYTEYAGDYCSYNETDGLFNEFFIDAVIEKYQNSTDVPPWIMAPYMYVLLQDIFANEYKGDKEEIHDAAKDLSDLISPYAGSLEQLIAFTTSFKTIYDEIFTDLEAVIEDMDSSNTEDLITITTTWSDLPEVQTATVTETEATEEEEEPIPEAAWTSGGAHTLDFGINYDSPSGHYAKLQTTFPSTFGSGLVEWTESGTPFTEISDFTSDHANEWGKSIYQRFTTPTEDGTSWVSYHIMVSEHEGKVRVREYKCPSDASGCWDQAITDNRMYDEEWEDERSSLT